MADEHPLKNITPEQINKRYKQGYLFASDRNELMRQKAELTLGDIIENQGIVKSYFTESIKHVQAQWDDIVQMADSYKPVKDSSVVGALKETGQELKMAGRIFIDVLSAITAPLTAFQEVNGETARRWAQDAGASPGLSALVGTVVNVGSGFVPVGKLSQAFARGVQKNVPEMAARLTKLSGAGKGAADTAKAAQEAKAAEQATKLADESVARGLMDDGVKPEGLEGFVDDIKSLTEPQKMLPQSTDFYKDLRKYHNEIKDVTETVHLKDIAKEADKLGVSVDDLKGLGRDTQLTPAQTVAYLKALDEPTNNLISNARRVLTGDAEAGLAQDRMIGEYFDYTPKFRSSQHISGLAVKVQDMDPRMKSITNMMAAWDPENMAKLDITAARRIVAEDFVALADEAEKLKMLQIQAALTPAAEKGTPTFWGKIRELYVNSLLATGVSSTRNFLGNSFAAVKSTTERELAGWLSIDEAKGVVKGESLAMLQGFTAAMGEGLSAYGKAFTKAGWENAGKLDYVPHQIQGPLGRIINIPGDNMRGMDNFFKHILRNADIYAQAKRNGIHQGLEGAALADYVARRRMVPTMDMIDHANTFALEQTFQNDLGTLGKSAQKVAQWGPLIGWFPFMKTPMNLAKYGWNSTPGLQLLSKSLYDDILAGGARADLAIGRLTLSNMIGMFWFSLHRQGVITDGGPVDPQLRRAWAATKTPYSIRTDTGFYPLTNMEPATTQMNLITDFSAVMNQLDDPTLEQTAMAIGLAGVRDIVDKSYWQTIGQVVDFLGAVKAGEEPGTNALKLLQGPLVTAITLGSLPAAVERVLDPVRREARGFFDQIQSRVPGYSETMPPVRDGYGDPVLPPAPLGSNWTGLLQPFSYRSNETIGGPADPIKKEGARLQAKLPMFPWSLGGKNQDDFDIRSALPGDQLPVPLTPQQRDRWQVIYRNMLRSEDFGIPALMQREEYQKAEIAGQRKMFLNELAKLRTTAKSALMVEDKELLKSAVKSKVGAVLPMIQESDRPQAEASTNEALDLIDSLPPDQQQNLTRWGILDSGEKRDQEIMTGVKMEIDKPIQELNKAAQQQQSGAQ
jgi:hypothetical protein